MNKELLISKRKKAKDLHEIGWSNREIARQLLVSKNSVGKWVQMDEREVLIDNRGRERGLSRKYAPETKQQIIRIREDLEKEDSYFIGSEVVRKNYENQTGKKVSKSYVDSALKEAGLVRSLGVEEKRTEQVHEIPEIYTDQIGQKYDEHRFHWPKVPQRL
uniref:Terminase ATPase subunit N-terminal domain-containing protein n=1 Tax=Candidatus Methanogaster sp. ANME-2c ERB4 TaxID=2759911 RepID=A0A7G9YNL0_9EURY|nr:hypothetical protein IDCAPMJN_00031 [Methanosarcinales archaeon ANME-2c ERB4]